MARQPTKKRDENKITNRKERFDKKFKKKLTLRIH